MRTALFLLLLLAVAAVPGSIVPQRGADPNGVVQYFNDHPSLAPVLDKLQLFDVFSSVWFSAIYLLLFISLIGCIIPRTKHHLDAVRAKPPRTPARLSRMVGYRTYTLPAAPEAEPSGARPAAIEHARTLLRSSGYRVALFQDARSQSVSGERGYLRETGNLVFHTALLGILLAVGLGGGFGYSGQKIVVEGQTFVNALVNYDSFNPGRFATRGDQLSPYSLTLDSLKVAYETKNTNAIGQPLDYTANVTARKPGTAATNTRIKVNEPLDIGGTNVYLLGNGYAPVVTVRDPSGQVAFTGAVPFVQPDVNNTSIGVIKVPDGLRQQLGLQGFFYPTKHQLPTGAYTSIFPGLRDPMLSLIVYGGDLGIDNGVPKSVYTLDTDHLTQLDGMGTDQPALQLAPGKTVELPNGLGTITLDGVKRYASLSINHDPAQGWVLVFALCVLGGLLTSLFVPRRRMWVKVIDEADGGLRFEYAGLARGDDPGLDAAVATLAQRHLAALGFATGDPGVDAGSSTSRRKA
ncbi:cytochrome c biogenesis protein ResB [Microbacterium sp. STN6]|nr:cytochrome c biogenesis protein ResB [Microbacterium sp. STN6]MCX7520678.1 cytochrome c biogenesis protein ResB [Microbacterium sp. STN6]